MNLAELLQQIHAAFDPATTLRPYIGILSRGARRRLIKSNVDHASRHPSGETELQVHRMGKDRDAETAQVASILRYVLWSRIQGGEDPLPLARHLTREFRQPLAEPATCARLMSYRAMLKEQIAALATDVDKFRCVEHPDRSRHFVHAIIEQLKSKEIRASWPGRSAELLMWDALLLRDEFAAVDLLHQLLSVDSRHPLVPTQYSIFVPSWNPDILVADALDQTILEARTNTAALQRLSGRDFERFLARIFESFGFDVDLTAATRDGGVDLICVSRRAGVPMKLAIEAKRYGPNRLIDVGLVRTFVGASAEWHANKLLYVTTSGYTRDAIKYAAAIQTNLLDLAATPDIIRWANDYVPNQSLVWPRPSP